MLGNVKSIARGIHTVPYSHSPTMKTLPGPFRSPPKEQIDPSLHISSYQLSSHVAREHGTMVLNRTALIYEEAPTLRLEGPNSFVATNRIIPQRITSDHFACA